MTTPPSPRTSSESIPTVVVASRLKLLSQAVRAVLEDSGIRSRASVWSGGPRRASRDFDSAGAVVLLDPMDTPLHVAQARRLVGGLVAPCLVLTEAPPGPSWGALLSRQGVAVRSADQSCSSLVSDVRSLLSGREIPPIHEGELDPTGEVPPVPWLLAQWEEWASTARDVRVRIDRLSGREREVLQLLSRGWRVPEIAELLSVAEGTVRGQVKSMRSKLGVGSQLAAVALFNHYSEPLPGIDRMVRATRPASRAPRRNPTS